MTKKDYIKLAELFNVCKNELNFISYTENEKEAITNFMNTVFIPNLSGILKADNRNFNYETFKEAIDFTKVKANSDFRSY